MSWAASKGRRPLPRRPSVGPTARRTIRRTIEIEALPIHDLDETFDALRGVLGRHAKRLLVLTDKHGDYQVASPTVTDRIGRPLFLAAVQIKKNYVSYHLIPVYAVPALLKTLSPQLKKRMQGRSCFNFTTVDTALLKELSDVTRAGLAAMKDVDLPWEKR